MDLPLALDIVTSVPEASVRPALGRDCRIVATVDLVAGEPVVVSVLATAPEGLDLRVLQAKFRWATPLEVITRTVPQLLALGQDPFAHQYATRGYPDAADIQRRPRRRLTDSFLEDIARRYIDIGRGYAEVIAAERSVSPRTVVSWVEKARARGILSPARPGAVSGELVAADDRFDPSTPQ